MGQITSRFKELEKKINDVPRAFSDLKETILDSIDSDSTETLYFESAWKDHVLPELKDQNWVAAYHEIEDIMVDFGFK